MFSKVFLQLLSRVAVPLSACIGQSLFEMYEFYAVRYCASQHSGEFLGAMQICITPTSYGNVAGWLAGCLSQPVLYQND